MKKNKLLIVVAILLLVAALSVTFFVVYNNAKERKLENEIRQHDADVKEHFNEFAITNKEAKIYKLDNDQMEEYGIIGKDVKISLTETYQDYYKIKGLDSYIYYLDVDKTDSYIYSDRYKNYIPYNSNIKTTDKTVFYDENDNLVYSINDSIDLPLIVYEYSEGKYGVEYNDRLLYIKKEDSEIYDHYNTDLVNKKKIRTITYHFFYDPETESCNEGICLSLAKAEEQFKYIRENNYFTLTMPELEQYMDGKIQIPQKSIVMTIDDGTIVNPKTLDLLEQYKINATMFIVTSWIDPKIYKSDYVELESHTHNMHNQYECPGYGLQGGGILCLPEDKVKEDLQKSQELLGGSKYLAYPFFDWNNRAIELLKATGFHMAFIGQYDTDGYSIPGVTDKFKMRRKTMFNDVSMNEFINEFLN